MKYSLYFFAEVAALVTSILSYRRIRNSHLRLFPIFLGVIVAFEFGVIQNWFTINHSNLWANNIITILQFTFYSVYLRSIVKGKEKKKSILIGLLLLLALTAINILFIQGFWRLHSYTLLLATIFIVFWICSFFSQLISMEETDVNLLRFSDFWISTGLLFFYLGCFTFFIFFEFMAYQGDFGYLTFSQIILNITNLILYLFLSIGFLCHHKTPQ